MKHAEFNWYAPDGQQIYGRVWAPPSGTNIQAVIILVHGMGEHSGRYQHFAEFFTDRDFAIVSFDLRGHGKSEGKRGHVSNYEVLLSLVDRCLEESSKRFPGEKKFVYGHSMGGNIAISHTMMHNPRILGTIASAPYLRTPMPISSFKLMQAKFMNKLWGSYAENNQIDTSQLSRDEQIVKAYENDDMVHPKISVRFFMGATMAADHCLNNASQLNIPMLIMHGTSDTITSFDASREFAEKAPNVTFKPWKGMYHEIHNEPEKEEVLNYAHEWMMERLKSSSSLL